MLTTRWKKWGFFTLRSAAPDELDEFDRAYFFVLFLSRSYRGVVVSLRGNGDDVDYISVFLVFF